MASLVYSGVNWSRVIRNTHSKLIPPRDGSVLVPLPLVWLSDLITSVTHTKSNPCVRERVSMFVMPTYLSCFYIHTN